MGHYEYLLFAEYNHVLTVPVRPSPSPFWTIPYIIPLLVYAQSSSWVELKITRLYTPAPLIAADLAGTSPGTN